MTENKALILYKDLFLFYHAAENTIKSKYPLKTSLCLLAKKMFSF